MALRSYAEIIEQHREEVPPSAAARVPVMHERGKRRKSRKRVMLAKKRPRDSKGHFLKVKAPKRRARRMNKTRVKRVRARARVAKAPKMKRLRSRPRRSAKKRATRRTKERRNMPRRNRKGRFVKGGGRRRRRARASAAEAPRRRRRRHHTRRNPTHRRRHYGRRAAPRRRHRSREKLPGGNVRVRRHRVTMKRRNIPTRGYTRHVSRRRYDRGPYVYRPSREELAAMNPIFAMENPLGAGEVIVTGLLMVVGFGLGSFVDRYIATNALTTVPGGQGAASTYTEAPAAGAVYNTEAVDAPMGLTRWLVGLGLPILLTGGAHYIGGPWVKVSLQGIGLGWGVRTLGKGLDDLMAYLLGKGAYGARLYASEIRAINAVKATGTTTLPTISSGAAGDPNSPIQTLAGIPEMMARRGMGAQTCGKCGAGVGACRCQFQPPAAAPAPATPAQAQANAQAAAAAAAGPVMAPAPVAAPLAGASGAPLAATPAFRRSGPAPGSGPRSRFGAAA